MHGSRCAFYRHINEKEMILDLKELTVSWENNKKDAIHYDWRHMRSETSMHREHKRGPHYQLGDPLNDS